VVLDEQQLRQRLEAVADRVSRPRLTIDGVTGRIRRRRAKVIGLVSGSLLAVAGSAVAVVVALVGIGTPSTVVPSKLPFELSFTVAVNGQSRVSPRSGPNFIVTPGENVRIDVGVTVPAHAKLTILYFGLARGAFGPGLDGSRPIGVHPILARTRKPLTSGLHTFRLTWSVPATGLRRRTTFDLVATWEARQIHASVGQFVAVLSLPQGPSRGGG
jgi:hypothetical protein